MSTLMIPMWMKVIINVEGCNVSKMQIKLQVTYSHLLKIYNDFEDKKWIKREKSGREWIVTLTDKGRSIQKHCLDLLDEVL